MPGQGASGDKGGKRLVPDRTTALMTRQMHVRVPAARHTESPAFYTADATLGHLHFDLGQPKMTPCLVDHATCNHIIVGRGWRIGAVSITDTTSTPFATRSDAVRCPSSLLVKIATCPAGVVAQRFA